MNKSGFAIVFIVFIVFELLIESGALNGKNIIYLFPLGLLGVIALSKYKKANSVPKDSELHAPNKQPVNYHQYEFYDDPKQYDHDPEDYKFDPDDFTYE